MKKPIDNAVWAAAFCGMIAAPASADADALRVSSIFPEAHFLWTEGGALFTKAVDEASGGEITFSEFHAGQLGKDQLAVLDAGLADIAVIAAPYAADKLPLTGVVELPGFIDSSCRGVEKFWPLAKEGGLLDESEYKPQGLRILFAAVPPPYKVMTTGAVVNTMDDLKGLKIRTVGGAQAETVRAVGATPVQVQAPELYDSLSRGTVDGAIYAFVGMPPFSLGEVVTNAVEGAYAGSLAVLFAISEDSWNDLSAEQQEVLTVAAAKAQKELCTYQDRDEVNLREKYAAENGLSVTVWSESEIALWNERMSTVSAAWATRLDDNGRPGSKLLEAYESSNN